MEERKLVSKLSEVMDEVKYIQKRGLNTFNNYKYATESDVSEKVREELAKRKVVMIPNMKSHSVREHKNRKGNIEYIVTAEVEFRFMDGETGESISFTMWGEGQDAGDKGVYKAITGAQKYALVKAFMIPTGDDPEGDTGVDERNSGDSSSQKPSPPSSQKSSTNSNAITPAQVKALGAKVNNVAKTNEQDPATVYQSAASHFKINKATKELTKAEASKIIDYLATLEG